MRELFGMSSRNPATVTLSLSIMAEHGGNTAPHKDGWGIAYYEDSDIRLLRDTTCASHSPWVQFVEQQEIRSTLVLSHIRKASAGIVAIKNTQPFSRELGGHVHVFAHNGHLPTLRKHTRFQSDTFRPIGDTDSEFGFCALLERLKPLWRTETRPDVAARLDVVAEFASDLRILGPANFLYCDGEVLFAHGHRRKQADGEFKPPGMHILHRICANVDPFSESAGVSVTAHSQNVILVASVPLTSEAWEPLREGEVLAIANGEVEFHRLTRDAGTSLSGTIPPRVGD